MRSIQGCCLVAHAGSALIKKLLKETGRGLLSFHQAQRFCAAASRDGAAGEQVRRVLAAGAGGRHATGICFAYDPPPIHLLQI